MKNKGVWVDEKRLKKMEQESWEKCLILSCSYLMDEMDYSEDRMLEYFDGMDRYISAVKEKLITIDKVCEIIEEHTGVKLKWRGK